MLTKQQTKVLEMVNQHYNNGNADSAARVLSSLYRSAMKRTQQEAVLKIAASLSLSSNPHFII
jgi:hypothetical protein